MKAFEKIPACLRRQGGILIRTAGGSRSEKTSEAIYALEVHWGYGPSKLKEIAAGISRERETKG